MIKLKFNIPLYDFDVTLLQIESKGDKEDVVKFMKGIKCQEQFITGVTDYIEKGAINGGETYRNFDLRKILVIFCPMKNESTRAEVYSHEKRHIEDRVMQHASVDDIESAGLLAGFLGRKFYQFMQLVKKDSNGNR